MLPRVLLLAGWLFPLLVLVLFVIKGQFYDPSAFTPPASEVTALPVPVMLDSWVLEGASVLPAERMFEKINGKADYYLQYGAVELSSGEWVADGQRWDMYLYCFETEQGARGAYNGEKPSDGEPVEGIEGYAVPGQTALAVGTYYLQLNALTAGADTAPAVKLATVLVSHLGSEAAGDDAETAIDLMALAGADMAGDAEGFLPESAFGFSAFNTVRTVEVSLNGTQTTWFMLAGDDGTVSAYVEELTMYGGEDVFTEGSAAGGSMFGSWSISGVLDGGVWGVQNAPSRESLMLHWNTLKQRITEGSEAP